MGNPHVATRSMKITDVKNQLSSLANEIHRQDTRVLVEKSGIPVAAIISVDDLRRLAAVEEEREELVDVMDRAREAFKDVDPEEIERETDRIIARTRIGSEPSEPPSAGDRS